MMTARVPEGRTPSQLRPVVIETDVNRYAEGSVIIKAGNTQVLCTASIEESVPAWLVGKGGCVFHWDGAAWSALPTGLDENAGGITALWGSGPGNVWAASRLGGPLLRYNGTRWSVVAGSGNLSVAAIGGTAAGELWTVGPAGAIRHRK